MVPVEGHLEQQCNARDASNFGAGIYADHFHLEKLLEFPAAENQAFRAWVEDARTLIIAHLRCLLDLRHAPTADQPTPVIQMDKREIPIRASI
jgi:hypothetical protein